MKKTKITILFLLALSLLSAFIPIKSGVNNITKWFCGIDSLIPYYGVYYNTETQKFVAYYYKGSGLINPPSADAPRVLVGDDKVISSDENSVTLDGSSSYSPINATPLTYLWEKTQGSGGTITSPTSATTTATGLVAGTTYKFRLTVTDADGNSASNTLTVTVSELVTGQFYVDDSALVNMTPVAQSVPGYYEMVGDPARSVVSVTTSQGWTVSTISTANWTGDPEHSDSSGLSAGQKFSLPDDPFGYQEFDSAVIATGFWNYNSQQTTGNYQLKVSGLDPQKLYQFVMTGSNDGNSSYDVLGTRTKYYINDDQTHNMNTYWGTAHTIRLDTVKSDASGNIYISVSGIGTSHVGGSNGIISGMKIYEISKTQQSGVTTYVFRHFYDTLRVWDGFTMRMCLVSKPYNYDPAKTYPILLYFAGGASTVMDTSSWDPEVCITEAMGYSIQHYNGKVYGITSTGDTAGFITVIPQPLLNISTGEYAGDGFDKPGRIETLLANFKSTTQYNYNDSLYIAGYSRGAAEVLQYVMRNPTTTVAAYIASPADQLTYYKNPTDAEMATFAQSLTSSDVKIYLMHREDFTTQQTADYIDTLEKYAPANIFHNYYPVSHLSFSYDLIMEPHNYWDQNVFDWLVNPEKSHMPVTKFTFDIGTLGQELGFTDIVNSKFNNQTSTDTTTGVTITTNKNGWANFNGRPTDYTTYGSDTLQNYNYDINYFFYTRGYGTNNTGGYVTWGDNMTLSNLEANTSYRIFFNGYGNRTANNIGVMWYNGGADSVVCKESYAVPERSTMHSITVTSSATGTIGLGFYPAYSQGDGIAYLGWMAIRKENQ